MTTPTPDPGARPVGALSRLASRLFARRFRFPPATRDATVRRVSVPMRDGVLLDADLFQPTTGGSRATILVRSPYPTRGLLAVVWGQSFAERGYTVLHQSCRGTFGSGGTFDPMRQEVADGIDTVAWLQAQSWYDGKLVLAGGSYMGWVEWALLTGRPPGIVAAVSMAGPHDIGRAVYRRGPMDLDNFLGWSENIAHQEDGGLPRTVLRALTVKRRLAPMFGAFSAGVIDPALQRAAPWFSEWAGHADLADPFWQPFNATAGLQGTTAPTLIVAGWQDLFLEQNIEQYRVLADRGVPTRLVIGPWTHIGMATNGGEAWAESYAWLDQVLRGTDLHGHRSVRLWVGGAGEWREFARWPEYAPVDWRLTPDRGLSPADPGGTGEAAFVYNPADPTPSVGGAVMTPGAGAADNRELERRADVLTFTSAALSEPLTVIGEVTAALDVTRDNPHADLFVRLTDVAPDGRSVNLCDGIVRLTQRDPLSGVVEVPLIAAAHRFGAGHRLRVIVAGGAFPRYSINPGTGRLIDTPDRHRGTRFTVRLEGRSLIRLAQTAATP